MIQGQLPLSWTEFIGRQRERASLSRLLLRARLVTVVGLSGVGKSRLARQVAEDLLPEFEGQVWFVPCEGLESAALIVPLLHEAAGLGSESSLEAPELLPALTSRRALLLLDSAECLLERGLRDLIRKWLERIPRLTLLLTSVTPTGLPGEHLFPLRPLDPPQLPGSDSDFESALAGAGCGAVAPNWLEADGLRVFEARAQQRECDWRLTAANLPTAVALCREMDWLPLGIELAAGQLSPWSEAQLLEEIRRRGHQLDLTTPGSVERHESLRRAISWNWSLLPVEEQSLISLMAALGGQLREEAIEPLTSDPRAPALATSLFRKGFLQARERAGRLCYALPELVRRGVDGLASAPRPALEGAAAFYAELADREGLRLETAKGAAAAELLRLEMPVLRRCWAWAREWDDGRLLRGFADALWGPLVHEMELPPDADDLVTAALAHTPEAGEEAARLGWIAGAVAARWGTVHAAATRLRDCLEPTAPEPVQALALRELGLLQLLQGQPLTACDSLQQSAVALSRLGMEAAAAWARRTLAAALERLGDRAGAERLLHEARLRFSELGLPLGQATVCADLARLAADEERWDAAELCSGEAIRHYTLLSHDSGWAAAALQVARVRARQGAFLEAQSLYREALRRLRAAGSAAPICQGLLQAAGERHPSARPFEPAMAYRECIRLAREKGLRSLHAHALRGLADLYAIESAAERALALAEEAVQVARQTTEAPLIQSCLDLVGRIQGAGPRPGIGPGTTGTAPIVRVEAVVVRELDAVVDHYPELSPAAPHSESLEAGMPAGWTQRHTARPRVSPIRVRLLGGMSLFVAEEEVPLLDWWAKAKKLFAYLVIHRGRPISRDILLEEFWPDGDQQRAIHSLQTTLSFLRRSLRALSVGENFAERLIVARDGNYLFDGASRCESDLQQFDEHVQEGTRLKASGHMEEAAAHWLEADRLYVGDLLPEFPYEDWCASPRERVRSHYLELLLNLGTYYRQSQRPREALRAAERMFMIDSCDERAHRMAMRCHVQLGRPVDALRQFERCCQVLERELRVQPSKATRDLHELIRARIQGARPSAPSSRSDSLPTRSFR